MCNLAFVKFLWTLLLTPTTVAGVKRLSESVCLCVCVCVSVCAHDKNQNGWNYNHQTCHRDSPSWVPATDLILGQRSRSQNQKVQKHNNNNNNNNNIVICKAHKVSSKTESEAPAVARWAALVGYGRTVLRWRSKVSAVGESLVSRGKSFQTVGAR